MINFLVVLVVTVFGTALLFTILIGRIISLPAIIKGNKVPETLRNNDYLIERILDEMQNIAEKNFEMRDEYRYNKINDKGNIIPLLSHFWRQNELSIKMNYNVKANWNPRYKFVKEVQNKFIENRDIYRRIDHFRKINDEIRKTTLWRMFLNI